MSTPTEPKRRRLEPPPPPNLTTSGLSICRNCNLVFRNANALNQHSKTENHKMVLDGLRPPFGAFFCLLCWVSFAQFINVEKSYHLFCVFLNLVPALNSETSGLKHVYNT